MIVSVLGPVAADAAAAAAAAAFVIPDRAIAALKNAASLPFTVVVGLVRSFECCT